MPNIVRDSADRERQLLFIVGILRKAEPADALGAVMAFLLQECMIHPHVVQRLFMTSVDRPGQTMLDVLNSTCGKV